MVEVGPSFSQIESSWNVFGSSILMFIMSRWQNWWKIFMFWVYFLLQILSRDSVTVSVGAVVSVQGSRNTQTSATLFGSTILMLNTYRIQNWSTADFVSRLRHGERGRGGLLQRHRLRASALQCWRLQVVPSSTSCVLKMIEYVWQPIKQHDQWKQSPHRVKI